MSSDRPRTPAPAPAVVIHTHAGAMAVANDPRTFSNAVSAHLQIPNGLDGAAHAAARQFLDPFLGTAEIDALEPALVSIAHTLVGGLARADTFDAVADLGARYAVRAQSAWLGWRADLEEPLLAWITASRAAVRSGRGPELRRVAEQFDSIIEGLVAERSGVFGTDLTSRLMSARTPEGRTLTQEELVSVLRNWTAGDLSSLALCAGVIVHWLATHPAHRIGLREAADADLDRAIDEMLRRDDPFVASRRVATHDTVVEGCPVSAGRVVRIDWHEANRDPAAFGDPDSFEPVAHAELNVVYGTGPHACPGRDLATRELRVLTRTLLAAGELRLRGPAERESPPVAGFRVVPVALVAESPSVPASAHTV